MCQLLGVKRQGYYAYLKRGSEQPDPDHEGLLEWVREIARLTDHTYGSRRMKKALNALSYPVSRQKARKLMIEAGVKVLRRRKYLYTTNSNHQLPVFTHLLERDFDVKQPNQPLCSRYSSQGTLKCALKKFRILLETLPSITESKIGLFGSTRERNS